MDSTVVCPLAGLVAQHLRDARTDLTSRWLARISERVALDPTRVFPSDDPLDHMPILIDGVADYVAEPALAIGADAAVMLKARELGALRHAQGFDEYEILKEFEIFGSILFAFLSRTVDALPPASIRGELATCCQRLFHAVTLIQQAALVQFHQLMRARVAEREQRLRLFSRALSHEVRNQVGAALGAGELLAGQLVTEPKRLQLAGIVVRNLTGTRVVLDNLLELTRLADSDARHQRHVRLPEAAAEAARELRDAAQSAGVDVQIDDRLPNVEVSAAAVELCLTNLLSNATKYADPAQAHCWVRVTGHVVGHRPGVAGQVVVEVHDNGLGVPPDDRPRLFERHFRAQAEQSARIRGTGLGLSIVRETVEALGCRAWAEFPEHGSIFCFTLPCRRASDATPEG